MDSTGEFYASGKESLLEDQSPKQNRSRKRLITAVFTSIIILIMIVGAAILAPMIQKYRDDSEFHPFRSNSTASVEDVCMFTPYFDSCVAVISSGIGPLETEPERIFTLSLQVSIDELSNLTSLPESLISGSNHSRIDSALRDCGNMLGKALSQLNESMAALKLTWEKKIRKEKTIRDMRTKIDDAMTDQGTCLVRLEMAGRSTVADEMRRRVQKSKEYASNTLSIHTYMDSITNVFYHGYEVYSQGPTFYYALGVCGFWLQYLVVFFLFCLLFRLG